MINLNLSIVLPYLIVIGLISLIDFITIIRSRLIKPVKDDGTNYSDDFTLLIPIFSDLKYLKNIEYLKQYGNKVVLCTTTKETKLFYQNITQIAQLYGFKIFRSEVQMASSKHKPNPWKLFTNTLNSSPENSINREIARDEIIKDSFEVVKTKYCIFIDGDTITKKPLQKLVGMIEKHQYDLASVRVLASKQDTLAEKLQAVEYQLAMDARLVYPWLTSGAGMISKTSVIKNIMRHHSLFFSGGDIEIGKLARMLDYKVGHLYFEFYTDVPETFKAWFKQRMAWCGGGVRHAVINLHQFSWKHPMFWLYTTFLVYLLTPIRWYEVIKQPQVIPLVIIMYWILIYTFHWHERKWYFILFPIYALVQILIIVPLGFYTYFKMAVHSDNVGFIKFREVRQDYL